MATVEGQASVVKGDSLLLLDDANSYWWLVRVLKTEDVGYIPAENVETPYERLARLNKHRNIDIAAPTKEEAAAGEAREAMRENKLKSLMGWKRALAKEPMPVDDDDVENREGRRVLFAAPTYVDHPGRTWSSDEEDEEDDEGDEMGSEGDVEDQLEHHLHDAEGYEIEPDDGVEWAQDAVEAIRSAGEESEDDDVDRHIQAHDPHEDAARDEIETNETHPTVSESHSSTLGLGPASTASPLSATGGAGVTAAAAGGAAVAAVAAAGAAATAAHHLGPAASIHPPDRSPSPAHQHGALSRTNPTPPPHRAPALTPDNATTPSPEPRARDEPVTPPPPIATSWVTTPVSSETPYTPSTPTQTTPTNTSPTKSLPRSTSSATTVTNVTVAPRPARKAAVWVEEAFDISLLSNLVRARAEEDKRTRRVPRPVESDAVQRTYYGEKLALDALQPEVRASYVHLQAKMDAFDRDLDDLLGMLVESRGRIARRRTPATA